MEEQDLEDIYRESIHALAARWVPDARIARPEQDRPEMTDRFITALHEAGHGVVAMQLTGDVAEIRLASDLAGHMTRSDDVVSMDINDPDDTRILNNAATSAAGCLTVAMATCRQAGVIGWGVVACAMRGASDDRLNIETQWDTISPDWDGTRESFVRAAHERAYTLLASNWQWVELIAAELVARGTVDSAQLRSITGRLQGHGLT